MPESCRAELVEGVVYMASPVRFHVHGYPFKVLAAWSGTYMIRTPGVLGGGDTTVRLDLDNEPQPDLLLFVAPEVGGRLKFGEDDYLEGSPEFVAEVSASSVSIDLHSKLRVYRRNKVQEYLVWRTEDHEIDWFVLRNGDYEKLAATDGILRSEVLPGLWLNARAILSGDFNAVLDTLCVGLASPEHQAFVARLAAQS
jgi:Uma2 family endonuclease